MLEREFPLVDREQLELVRRLGEGGFAITHLARDGRGRLVVVKQLRRADDPEMVRRFAEEARLLTRLDAPTIVQVLQKGRWGDGTLFFVMEHVAGAPLSDLLDATDLAAQLDGLTALVDVATALEHAHGRGVVHRDIKPGNVIVRDDGRAVVIDWGIAAAVGGAGGEVIGTPFFMSPEQGTGAPPAPPMDVYSLGATTYHALSGAPPYAAMMPPNPTIEDFHTLLQMRGPAPIAAAAHPALHDVAALAMRCLSRAPAERPSAEEAARTLRVAAQRCLCARCGQLGERASATRSPDGRWVCGACHVLGAFDELEGTSVAPPAVFPPLPPPVTTSMPPPPLAAPRASGFPPPRLEIGSITGVTLVDEHAGIRSSAGRDDLGRAVRVEVAVDATADARVNAGRDMLIQAASPALPRVLRAGDLDGRPGLVREDASGPSLRSVLGETITPARRMELLEGYSALCQAMVRVHAAGFAHRRLSADDLVLADAAGTPALVAVEWRDAVRIEAPSDPWQARPDADKLADVRALAQGIEDVLRGHQPTEGLGKVAKVVSGIRTAHAPTPTDLVRLSETLGPLTQKVSCLSCGARVLQQTATLSGRGYWCAACARQTLQAGNADVELNFTGVEQDGLYAGNRSRFWGSLAAMAVCAVAFVGLGLMQVRGGGQYLVMAFFAAAASASWHWSQMRRFGRARNERLAAASALPPPPGALPPPDALAATDAGSPDAFAPTQAPGVVSDEPR